MRYNHFSMLPEQAFQPRNGRHGMTLEGGGGGAPTQTTTYTSNIPEYLRPQVEALIGGATQEYFGTKPVTTTDPVTGETKTEYQITGVKPFVPYSTNVQDYLAQFSPLQQQAQYEAARMQRPGQFEMGSQFAGQAGMGGMQTAQQAMGYGGMGAGYGGQAAAMSPEAQRISQLGAGTGARYEQMATDPRAMQAYMSPYMQNVVDTQKQAAIRDYQEQIMPQLRAQAVRAGAFGGSRDAVQRAIAQRNLSSQLQGIQATGTQKAFEDAQRAQQFGITSGLQGYQTGLQGLGQAGQLYGLGMQGAQVGLQGVQGAQAGYGLMGQMGRTMSDIGTAQQASDVARMDLQSRLGGAQQAREQALIDQSIKNYQMAREYPYEQLSRYSGLLRGYYTPTTTATTYQAYNPAAQLVGTAAQAYGTYKGLAGKEGGQVKAYAKGGILDSKVFNNPTAFSPEMINKGMQNDSISDVIGAIGLSQIAEARKGAQQSQALSKPAPEGTVLSDLQQQAMGIEAAPTQLPTSMAGGGIVVFDEGGLNRAIDEAEGISGSYAGVPDIESLTRAAIARRQGIGLGEDEKAYQDYLKKRPEELAKQRQMDRYLALARFGAGMSRAKTRNFLQAVGEGTEAALPALAEGEKAYRTGTTEAMRGLAEMGRASRAEQLKGLEVGEAEFRSLQERQAAERRAELDRTARAEEGRLDRANRLAIANIPAKELQVAAQLRKDNPNLSYLDSITQASQSMAPKDTYNATRTAVSAAAKDANAEFMQRATFDPKLQEDMRKAAAGDAAAQQRINAIKSKIQEDIFKLYQVQGVDLSGGRMGSTSTPRPGAGGTANDPLGIR